MTTSASASLYGIGASSTSLNQLGIIPVSATYSPGASNIMGSAGMFNVGQTWVNTSANVVYVLTSISTSGGVTSATWTATQSAGTVLTLTGDSGGATSPTGGGTITLAGTAGQIHTAGAGNTITFSIPSTAVAPGSLEVTGLLKGDASATINTAGTALNLATDNDTAQVNIGTGTSGRTIDIGTAAAAFLVNIGSVTGASSMSLKFGSGNCSIAGAVGSTITIGAAAQTGTISIGTSTATSAVNVATGNGNKTYSLCTGTGTNTVHLVDGNGTNTITFGNGATAVTSLTMGSAHTTSSTAIQGGTGAGVGGISYNSSLFSTLGAIATTSVDGFLYSPSCAGAPTGVATARGSGGGDVPFIFDTSTGTGKLWAYIGGSWVGVALS